MFGFLHQQVGAAVMAGREPGPRARSSSWPWGSSSPWPPRPAPTWRGRAAIAWDPDTPAADAWAERLCGSPCFTIAGGTTEVLKNLTAERVLGLPRDMADDRDVPFDEWIRSRRQAMTFTPQLTINGRQVDATWARRSTTSTPTSRR